MISATVWRDRIHLVQGRGFSNADSGKGQSQALQKMELDQLTFVWPCSSPNSALSLYMTTPISMACPRVRAKVVGDKVAGAKKFIVAARTLKMFLRFND